MIMDFCGCQTCYDKNKFKEISLDNIENMYQYFRYACEICGNKRCQHHHNHEYKCNNSNEPNQKGIIE